MLRKRRSTEERLDDLEAAVAEIKTDRSTWVDFFRDAKRDRQKIRIELKTEIKAVRAELKAEIKAVRAEIKAVKDELKSDIENLYERIRKLLIKKL